MLKWFKEGKSKAEIMSLTGRAKATVALQLQRPASAVGRKCKVTPKVFKKLSRALTVLQKKAHAKKEVTVAMVKEQAKVDATDRTVLDAFHKKDIWFRPLRQKPILTPDDIQQRRVFASTYRKRAAKTWVVQPHAVIDNKHFPLFRDRKGRAEAARRQVRGAFRKRGAKPQTWMVKSKASMKFPVRGVQVTAAVIKGKIRMWDYVDGQWGAQAAVRMYKGPLLKALQKAYTTKKTFTVLEDNDPAGYKTKAALAAKTSVGINTMKLPPRSPDLNVLDYSLWHAINVITRKQEASMGGKKRESEEEFKARLRRVALGLPAAQVTRAVMDMRRRVQLLHEAKGSLFQEAK